MFIFFVAQMVTHLGEFNCSIKSSFNQDSLAICLSRIGGREKMLQAVAQGLPNFPNLYLPSEWCEGACEGENCCDESQFSNLDKA